MDETVVDDLMALLPPLLGALEALGFITRYLDPDDVAAVVASVGTPDSDLRAARTSLHDWPDRLSDTRGRLDAASDEVLAAFEGVRAALAEGTDLRAVFRALRHASRAQEAIYPLAAKLPPISSFFVDPPLRDDAALQARLAAPAIEGETGLIQAGEEAGRRGGFALYVPETYRSDQAWQLVMALHGGSGNGRAFVWSWLRDARSHGAILVAPTATGPTWALMGDDADTPNLVRILEMVQSRWTIDPARLLLTGLSDGGTFCYVSGLQAGSPFTHLAPVAATFHPGRRDWMFPVEIARRAKQTLSAAGAHVTYREIDDLSHTYPREMNAAILAWLGHPDLDQ
jgi:phospholipase/carboxylesterase